jgi:Ribbon-helix-helix protein, copG family
MESELAALDGERYSSYGIPRSNMGAKKFAISVSEEVMEKVDRAAAERGVTRSRFISEVLRKVARARGDAEVTKRLDRLFSNPRLAEEQRATALEFRRAGSEIGTEW